MSVRHRIARPRGPDRPRIRAARPRRFELAIPCECGRNVGACRARRRKDEERRSFVPVASSAIPEGRRSRRRAVTHAPDGRRGLALSWAASSALQSCRGTDAPAPRPLRRVALPTHPRQQCPDRRAGVGNVRHCRNTRTECRGVSRPRQHGMAGAWEHGPVQRDSTRRAGK